MPRTFSWRHKNGRTVLFCTRKFVPAALHAYRELVLANWCWLLPGQVWKDMPTFVVGEFMFLLGAVIMLVHAKSHGRLHLLTWFSALVAGSANDAFFMYIPIVDNFWQAQASIMLSPRMPLYIPCVYIVFMYSATVSVWRLRLKSALAEACLAGLAAEMIYAPYDIVGAKFLVGRAVPAGRCLLVSVPLPRIRPCWRCSSSLAASGPPATLLAAVW